MTYDGTSVPLDGAEWLTLLREVVSEIQLALAGFTRWGEMGERPYQYALDLVADAAALKVLAGVQAAGIDVLSEESGFLVGADAASSVNGASAAGSVNKTSAVVIIDPVDGSTNASRRVPYYSTSLCVLGVDGFEVGLVTDLAAGTEWTAIAGQGAWCDGVRLGGAGATTGAQDMPSNERDIPTDERSVDVQLSRALVSCNGALPPTVKCDQFRTMGSAALDLCGVASGRFDAYVDTKRALRVWDYAAGVLICQEAGMFTDELDGEPLEHIDPDRRLGPIAATNNHLAEQLRRAVNGTALSG